MLLTADFVSSCISRIMLPISTVDTPVRKLAERSARSAGEITAVTVSLKGKSTLVDRSVDDGLSSLAASLDVLKNLAQTLANTTRSVEKTSSGVEDVTASVQEQKAASASIAQNVEAIAQMAEANRAASNESSAASERLEQLAVALKALVERFKV